MESNFDPNAKVGLRIRNIRMNDPHPVDEGMEGTITSIDSLGTIHVRWDNGSSLGVVPGEDEYQILPALDDQIDLNVFESKEGPLTKNYKSAFKQAVSKARPKIKVEGDELKGGKADKMSIADLARKHKVSVKDIKKEIEIGKKIESEHVGSDMKKAEEIARDHISEFPDYYSNKRYGVKAVEKKMKKLHENKSEEFKTHLQKIVDAIKTAKFIHKESIEKMIDNFYHKYKDSVSDIDKFNEIYTNLKDSLEKKFGVDETTSTGGGVSTGFFVGPLGRDEKNESIILTGRDFLKEYTTIRNTDYTDGSSSGNDKETWSNKSDGWRWNDKPIWEGGVIVDTLANLDTTWDDGNLDISKEWDRTQKNNVTEGWFKKTPEDKIVLDVLKRVKENLPQVTDFQSNKIRFDLETVRGNTRIEIKREINENDFSFKLYDYRMWVNGRELNYSRWAIKKLWNYLTKILNKEKREKERREIEADLLDPNYAQDVFNQLNDMGAANMDESVKKNKTIHTKKWDRCVEKVKKNSPDVDPYAVCTDSIGYEGSIKKSHRKKEPSELEEETTMGSVWGSSGPPVGPAFAAKKGDWKAAKKPIWKGGTILQKEEDNNETVLRPIGESLRKEIKIFREEYGRNYRIDDLYEIIYDELINIPSQSRAGYTLLDDFRVIMSSPIGGIENFMTGHGEGRGVTYDYDTGRSQVSGPHGMLMIGILPKLKELGIIKGPLSDPNELAILNRIGILFYNDIRHTLSNDSDFSGRGFMGIDDDGNPITEVNKVKFVKGGKYMKIKDKCSKYNNGPHCSQGAIDDPLILSDKTFESIESISKRTGLTSEQIIDKINNYLRKG